MLFALPRLACLPELLSQVMKPFTFICGDDDFLVGREGQAVFAEMTKDLADDFAKETIDGAAQNVGEVETALNQFRSATQTMSMFGDKKVVWLKDVNFFADSVTGRAESTKKLVTEWQEELTRLDPSAVDVLITAHPVDRRRKEFKWFAKNSNYSDLKSGGSDDFLLDLIASESKRLGVRFTAGAAQTLIGLVSGNTRLVLEETRKLSAYVGQGEVGEAVVIEMVPHFGEGDFFEPVEAFFTMDLNWTLDALRRYFFIHKEARPLISNLQGRNRLLIQLRVLMDSGEISLGPRGFSKSGFEAAQRKYQQHFGGLDDKSNFNVFTQNLWYLGNKVAAGPVTRLKLKQLVDFQIAFTRAFEDLIRKPNDQHAVMRDLAISCLQKS